MEALHRQLKEAVLRSGNMCRGTTTECDTGQECLDRTTAGVQIVNYQIDR